MRDLPTIDWLSDDMDDTDAVDRRCLELIERETQNAWAALLDTEQGRLIAWSILDHTHIFSSSFTGNANQAFLEGERSVGLKILKGHILPNGNHLIGEMMDEASARHDRLMLVAQAQINGEQNDE
jgi:hypothetical protein